jgi:hypothetical protein
VLVPRTRPQDAAEIGRGQDGHARIVRRLIEHVGFGRLQAERERGQRIGDEVEPKELHRRQRRRTAE